MLEMQQISRAVLLFGVGWMAFSDSRHRQVSVPFAFLLLAAGLLLRAISGESLLSGMAGSLTAGICFALFAGMSGGSVGYGDALAFAVTGMYLGTVRNLFLICGSFFICGVTVFVLLILRRTKRNEKIAFIPFILIAYVAFGCFPE